VKSIHVPLTSVDVDSIWCSIWRCMWQCGWCLLDWIKLCCFAGNTTQYTGLVHAAFSEHSVVTGGSIGPCCGGDALPIRPFQVKKDLLHAWHLKGIVYPILFASHSSVEHNGWYFEKCVSVVVFSFLHTMKVNGVQCCLDPSVPWSIFFCVLQ